MHRDRTPEEGRRTHLREGTTVGLPGATGLGQVGPAVRRSGHTRANGPRSTAVGPSAASTRLPAATTAARSSSTSCQRSATFRWQHWHPGTSERSSWVSSGPAKHRRASGSTLRHCASVLATAVEEEGLIAVNPASAVRIAGRRDGHEEREPRVLTRGEIRTSWRFPLAAFLRTALAQRRAHLRSDRFALGRCRAGRTPASADSPPGVPWARQAPKSRYGRRDIPLSQGMAATLAALRASAGGDSAEGPVFRSTSGGCLDVSNVRSRVLGPAAARAGVPGLGFHTFRHTCASLLFAAGKDLKQVQHWLGHHDAAFTLSTSTSTCWTAGWATRTSSTRSERQRELAASVGQFPRRTMQPAERSLTV